MIEENDELCDADVCSIILDSGATKSIYGSRELLVNISEMQNPESVKTINSMAAINHSGNCVITLIWKMVNTAVFLSFISSAMIVLSSLRIFSNISSFILTFVLSEN